MTDPKVLADALVEAGILHFDGEDIEGGKWYGLGLFRQQAETMISDWRVAGKVLESWRESSNRNVKIYGSYSDDDHAVIFHHHFGSNDLPSGSAHNNSLPRAIIEAWYEAQQ